MLNFACLNLDQYYFESNMKKVNSSKTTINYSSDLSSYYGDPSCSISPERKNCSATGAKDLDSKGLNTAVKFVFKKDL